MHWSLLALSGHSSRTGVCPLLDQSRQNLILARNGMSAFDPKQTSGLLRNRRSVVSQFSLAAQSQNDRLQALDVIGLWQATFVPPFIQQ